MFRNFWSKWLKPRLSAKTIRRAMAMKRPRTVLRIEVLEDRTLPTIVYLPALGAEQETRDNGGRLNDPPLYLDFWGSYWTTTAGLSNEFTLISSVTSLLQSPYLSGLTEYNFSPNASLQFFSIDPNDPQVNGQPLLNNFPAVIPGSSILSEVQNDVSNNREPSGSTNGNPPIYFVITPPGVSTNQVGAAGFNNAGGGYNFAWVSTSANSNGSINTAPFTQFFGHELVESMTDPGQGGFEISAGSTFAQLFPSLVPNGSQICDYEPNIELYQYPDGLVVQPYFSQQDGDYIVPDGNSEQFDLSPVWTGASAPLPSSFSYANSYALTVNMDQSSTFTNTLNIDVVDGALTVTLDNQTASFPGLTISSITVNMAQGSATDYLNVDSLPAGTPLTVNPGFGYADVSISPNAQNLTTIQSNITIGYGAVALTVYDQSNTQASSYTLTGASLTMPNGNTISFSELNSLTLYGGSASGNGYAIENTIPLSIDQINTGAGLDQVIVGNTGAFSTLTFNDGDSTTMLIAGTGLGSNLDINSTNDDYITLNNDLLGGLFGGSGLLGDGGTAENILGTIAIQSSQVSDGDQLTIDDAGNAFTGNPTVTVTSDSVAGLTPNPVTFADGTLNQLTLDGGTGGMTWDVESTVARVLPPPGYTGGFPVDEATIINSNGPDTIQVGDANGLEDLKGLRLGVNSSVPQSDTVNLNDQPDTTPRVVTMDVDNQSNYEINGLASSDFTFGQYAVGALNINSGTGGDTFKVQSTPASYIASFFPQPITYPTTTTINSSGSDDIEVGDANGVQDILGPLVVNGIFGTLVNGNSPDADTLSLNDQADTAPRTVAITNGSITGLAPATISYGQYSLGSLNINGGTGGDVFEAQSTAAPDNMQFFGGPVYYTVTTITSDGSDTVLVGDSNGVQDIQGQLVLKGSADPVPVTLDDANDPTGQTVTVTGSSVTGLAPAEIDYGGLEGSTTAALFEIMGGAGGDSWNVQSTSRWTTITSNGPDTFTVGDANGMLDIADRLTLDTDVNSFKQIDLTLDDQGDSQAHPNVILNNGSVTGLAPAIIDFSSAAEGLALNELDIEAGSGGTAFNVEGSPGLANVNLSAQGTNNSLTGPNSPVTWNFAPTGDYLSMGAAFGPVYFSGIQKLQGGSGDDDFVFMNTESFGGAIDGGAGMNTLDFGQFGAPVTVTVTGPGTIVGVQGTASCLYDPGTFNNIDDIIGSTGSTFDGSGYTGNFSSSLSVSGFATVQWYVTGNFTGMLNAPTEGSAGDPISSIQIGGMMGAGAMINVGFLNSLDIAGDMDGTVKAFGMDPYVPSLQSLTIGGEFASTGEIVAPSFGMVEFMKDFSGLLNETSTLDEFTSLRIDGSLLASGIVAAGPVEELFVQNDFAGKAAFAGSVGSLTVGDNLAGVAAAEDFGSQSVGGQTTGSVTTTPTPGVPFDIAPGDVAGLIQALDQANGIGGLPIIISLAAGSTYALSTPDNYWYGPNGLPAIAADVTINGNGATIERVGSTPFRIFYVSGGFDGLPAGQLTLNNMTVEGGLAEGGNGGDGIAGGGGGAGLGGAIFNQGNLNLSGVTLTGNTAQGGEGGQQITNGTSDAGGGGGGLGGNGGEGDGSSGGGGGGFGADGASGSSMPAPAEGGSYGAPGAPGFAGFGGAGGGWAYGYGATGQLVQTSQGEWPIPVVYLVDGGGGGGFGSADAGNFGDTVSNLTPPFPTFPFVNQGLGGGLGGFGGAGGSDFFTDPTPVLGDGGDGGFGQGNSASGGGLGGGGGGGGDTYFPSDEYVNSSGYEYYQPAGLYTGGAGGGGVGGGGGGAAGSAGAGGGGFGGGGGGSASASAGGGGFGGGGGGGVWAGGPSGANGGFGAGNGTLDGGAGAGMGGAIFSMFGTVNITNSTLAGNSAVGGGAQAQPLEGPNTQPVGNSGAGYGGGVFNLDGTVVLINDTLAGNLVVPGNGNTGDDVYNLAYGNDISTGQGTVASVTLINDILAGSSTGSGNDLVSNADNAASGPNNSGDHALVYIIGPTLVQNGLSAINGPINNFNNSLMTGIDPTLGPLQNNGGPTPTMEVLAGSPVLADPGAPAGSLPGIPVSDQRGVARGATTDIGAYQATTATQLGVSGFPALVDAGATNSFTVTAEDPFGKTVYGDSEGISVTATCPANFASMTASLTDGVATFQGSLNIVGVQSIMAFGITTNGIIEGDEAPIVVAPAVVGNGFAPAFVTVSSGSPQSTEVGADFAEPLVALVTSQEGVPLMGVTVTFTVEPDDDAGGTFGSATYVSAVTNANGLATALPLVTANDVTGTYTVVATAGGATSATFDLTNTPGPTSQLTLLNVPATLTVGDPLVFQVDLDDAFMNIVDNDHSNVMVTIASAAMTISRMVQASDGVAGFSDLPMLPPGAYTLTASVNGANGTITNFTNFTVQQTDQLVLDPESTPQQTTVGTDFSYPLRAQVIDGNGNGVAGQSVSFTINSEDGASGSFLGAGPPTTDALSFNGTSADEVTVPNSPSLQSPALNNTATLEAWVYLNQLPSAAGHYMSIIGQSEFGNDLNLQVETDNRVYMYAGDINPGSANFVASNTVLQTGVWYWIVGTYQANDVRPGVLQIYIDGNLDASQTGNFERATNPNPLTIGWDDVFPGRYLNGLVADPSIWDTVETQAQIQSQMTSQLKGNEPRLIGAWQFSEQSGTTAYDLTANQNNGTLSSASMWTAQLPETTTVTATTDADGWAVVGGDTGQPNFLANATADPGGHYTVTATFGSQSLNYDLTNEPAPTALTYISGNDVSTAVETTQAQNPLEVQLLDGSTPVPNWPVTFMPSQGSTGADWLNAAPVTVDTNSDGDAILPYTANVITGGYTVTASAAGSGGRVLQYTFESLTNTTAPGKMAGSGSFQATVNTDFSAAPPPQATVTNASGEPIAGVTVYWAVGSFLPGAAGGSFPAFPSGPATSTTNSSGVASAPTILANTVAGTWTLYAGADGQNTTFSMTNKPGAAAHVVTIAGSPQSAVVATKFATAFSVEVTDQFNNPVLAGTAVTFSAPAFTVPAIPPASAASGTFATTGTTTVTATTNSLGIATAPAFTANTRASSQSYNVTASVSGASQGFFALTNLPGTAEHVLAFAGTPQSAAVDTNFATLLAAEVTDAFNNPVLAGTTVTFAAPTSGASGTFGAAATITASTDSQGVATAATPVTANTKPGSYHVTASVAVTGATSAAFALTNQAGAPAFVQASAGSPQSTIVNTNFATLLSAKLTDQFGDPVTGITVTFTAPTSGPCGTFGAASSATAVTNSLGVATVATAFKANTLAGTYSVIASVPGATSAAFALTNKPGAAAHVQATAGTPQSATVNANFASAFSALVTDQFGNVIPGTTVTFAAPTSGASGTFGAASSTTALTNSLGVATTATAFKASTKAGSYNVTASVAVAGATSASFAMTNLPGAAFRVQTVAGTPQSATVNTSFATAMEVLVTDQFNNPLPAGTVVTLTAPTFGSDSSGPTGTFAGNAASVQVLTNSQGQATAPTFTANTVASSSSYSVTAAAAGASSAAFVLTNLPGSPAHVVALAGTPQSATVNTSFATRFAVEVTDQFGNLINGAIVKFTAPTATLAALPTGTFSGAATTTVVTGGQGLAGAAIAPAFTANSLAGSYNVSAAATGATSATFALTNTAAAPSVVTVVGSASVTALADAAFAPLTVSVTDSLGNPVVGATVTFTVHPAANGAEATFAGNALTATAVTTLVNGVAEATTPTLTAGSRVDTSYTLVASVPNGTTSATFTLRNNADPVAGPSQSAVVNTPYATDLYAKVTDALGRPIPGVTVTFKAPASGPSGTFAGKPTATAVTNALGVATAPAFKANTKAGSFVVTVGFGAAAAPETIQLTNLPGPPARLIALPYFPDVSGFLDGPFAGPEAEVTDAFGNPISGVTVTFSVQANPTNGAGALFNQAQSSATGVTSANGIAAAPVLRANGIDGLFTITAVTAGIDQGATFALMT